MMKSTLMFSAALLMGSGAALPAFAQDAAAPQQAAPTQPAASTFTDAELVGFANAAIEADKIQKDAAIAPEEKQTQMLAAVQAQGLEPTRYNEIAQATRNDPELVKKIQELAAAHMASQSNTATP